MIEIVIINGVTSNASDTTHDQHLKRGIPQNRKSLQGYEAPSWSKTHPNASRVVLWGFDQDGASLRTR